VTIIDPQVKWTIDAGLFASKSRNTPFHGREVRGRAVCTIVNGEVRHPASGMAH
jgi:dihydroorotase